jgi:hypothetical protein
MTRRKKDSGRNALSQWRSALRSVIFSNGIASSSPYPGIERRWKLIRLYSAHAGLAGVQR